MKTEDYFKKNEPTLHFLLEKTISQSSLNALYKAIALYAHEQNKGHMGNVVLSPIDPEYLIDMIAEKIAKKTSAIAMEQPKESKDDFLTIQQAAEFLKLSVPTIYSKVSKRQLPFMKRGKRLYFSLKELSDYLNGGKIDSYDA